MRFLDAVNSFTNQALDAAAIIGPDGRKAGNIIVRYTKGVYGPNATIGAVLWPSDLDFSTVRRGRASDKMIILNDLMAPHGIEVLTEQSDGTLEPAKIYSDIKRVDVLRHNGIDYRVYWAL